MEQMYLLEILIDKVKVFAKEIEHSEDKKLIIKTRFGPKVEFIIKEGQLANNPDEKDMLFEENGIQKWARSIRVGKSYLFPSYPDTILMILNKFPLEIEVWTDDKKEDLNEFIGIGTMYWDANFFQMLKTNTDLCRIYEPLTIKQNTTLSAECCCREVGEVEFILRLSALGESIITEFQQLMKEPENFVFRTNKAPGMFKCNQVDGDDPSFCMVGSLYETTTLNDPIYKGQSQEKIEVCTNMESCGHDHVSKPKESLDKRNIKKYPIDKIRMGDITGPCGNTSCPLAHKVKKYIRNLDTYKNATKGIVTGSKPIDLSKVCGSCVCKDDREHRADCPEKQRKAKSNKALCLNCGGVTQAGGTCAEKKMKMYGTGATPKGSKSVMTYVLHTNKNNDVKGCILGEQFTLQGLKFSQEADFLRSPDNNYSDSSNTLYKTSSENMVHLTLENKLSNPNLYSFKITESKRKFAILNCRGVLNGKECKCSASETLHKKSCKAPDCKCLAKAKSLATRKAHKPYCPSYIHKDNCPVTLLNEERETNYNDEDENSDEPLPYGLQPVTLGPCPVIGRPCTVPDGFARMYKAAAVDPLPPSYNKASKVCCSKEFERIKKALREYMAPEKTHDLRCVKEFYADTDRRCCDKEQTLMSLTGKDCCGTHKLAIQEKFNRKS